VNFNGTQPALKQVLKDLRLSVPDGVFDGNQSHEWLNMPSEIQSPPNMFAEEFNDGTNAHVTPILEQDHEIDKVNTE
jgi:hypothetical protein